MTTYTLAVKVAPGIPVMSDPTDIWGHDPSAALFKNGSLVFCAEEERFNRQKHSVGEFPMSAVRACLDHRDLTLDDVDAVTIPFDPSLLMNVAPAFFTEMLRTGQSISRKAYLISKGALDFGKKRLATVDIVRERLSTLGEVPPIETYGHHKTHAASAFYPSQFSEALVLTIDGKGEYDSTVVWRGTPDGLERIRTYEHPNSLGRLYGIITSYLGYRPNNGEGKIMGLAPYGSENDEIRTTLESLVDTGVDYDVTDVTSGGIQNGLAKLEDHFGRPARDGGGKFSEWEQDLAYETQSLLEQIVCSITEHYSAETEFSNVCLAGGVALNCKMNKTVRELDAVDRTFVQPVANDAGTVLGAGWLRQSPADVEEQTHVYYGPEYGTNEIQDLLEQTKVDYRRPDDLERTVAEALVDGQLVGWFQGRMEVGPRALGHRSIIADPRDEASRDRVNKYVKHREEWRPFAPSILADRADEYFEAATPSPFMIDTFDTVPERRDEIEAVLHRGDNTTRPQTVTREANPRYYDLISAFDDLTDVPVVLNTSFNDHAEPIVNRPSEALKDFYGMGLDMLVLEDIVIEK
jgi:carbamoyltransferase